MNHEPIQFLPVAPFWRPEPKPRTQRALCIGIAIGSALTLVVAVVMIELPKVLAALAGLQYWD